jgi:hypothetical protein
MRTLGASRRSRPASSVMSALATRVLVMTSNDRLGAIGRTTGDWASEFTHA